jgi:hypothetical protein
VSEEEIEKRLHERLSKLLTPADGATIKEIDHVQQETALDEEISAVAERTHA